MIIKVPTKFGTYYVEAIRFTKRNIFTQIFLNPITIDIIMVITFILVIGLLK